MKARVIKPFRDKYTKGDYETNQIVTVTKERFEEINSAALGPFVKEIRESKKPPKKTKKKNK